VGGDEAVVRRGAIARVAILSEPDQTVTLLLEFLDVGRIAPGGFFLGQLDHLGMPS
jgi:hypothetical protein